MMYVHAKFSHHLHIIDESISTQESKHRKKYSRTAPRIDVHQARNVINLFYRKVIIRIENWNTARSRLLNKSIVHTLYYTNK